MKIYKTKLSLLLIALTCLSCGETKEISNSNDMLQMTMLTEKIELSIGEKAYYAGTVHGSVGTQKECWSNDGAILKLTGKDFKYHKPLVEGETGGDRATETYTFEALAEGKTTVTIQDWFRGEMQSEHTIQIIVTK